MKLLKSRKFITASLIIITIIAEIISSIIFFLLQGSKTQTYIETLYYSSQIVSSIFVISGVVIAVWQYYLSSKSAKTDLEIQQVQRAVALSEYYKDNILRYSPAIKYVYEKTGIMDILDTLKLEQFNDFDKYELNDLFTLEKIKQLKEIQESNSFLYAVLEANTIYSLHLEFQTIKTEENDNNPCTSLFYGS